MFSLLRRRVVAVAFQGLSFFLFRLSFSGFVFFPLNRWYTANGAVPSVFALAGVVARCALSRCGVLVLLGF